MTTIDPSAHLARVRETAPLIHNITNFVAMNAMANVLLAIGASPAMVHAREEHETGNHKRTPLIRGGGKRPPSPSR